MRKWMSLLLAAILMLSLLPASGLTEASTTRYIVSQNGETVNLRSGPGTNYSVVTRIKSGTSVEYVETEDGWCLVRYKNMSGYVDGTFVVTALATATPKATAAPAAKQAESLAYITSQNGKPVNLRSGPGRSYDSVGTADVGKAVTVLERNKTWSKVRVDGRECYVMTAFLSAEKPDITAAPTAAPTQTPAPVVKTTAYITSTNGGPVRVRKGPGTSYGVAGELSYGTKVTADEVRGKWQHITSGNVDGYVMQRYLTSEKPDSSATATPKPEATEENEVSIRAYIYSENGKSVRVRKSASSNGSVLTSLDYGTEVTITQEGKTWSRITGSFGTGYVMSSFLTTEKPEAYATPEPAFKSYTAYVYSSNGKSVNLRKGAGTRYESLASLDVGTELTVIGESGNWKKVVAGNETGYIMNTYVSETKPAAPEEQTVSPSWIPATGSRVYIAASRNGAVRTYTSAGSRTADGKAYPVGTPATVKAVQDGWVKLSVGSTTCYLPLSSIASTGAGAIPNSANRLIYYLTGSDGTVSVRRAKQPESNSLGAFMTGTAVIVMSRNSDEGWAYIQVGSTKGYVDIDQIKSRP